MRLVIIAYDCRSVSSEPQQCSLSLCLSVSVSGISRTVSSSFGHQYSLLKTNDEQGNQYKQLNTAPCSQPLAQSQRHFLQVSSAGAKGELQGPFDGGCILASVPSRWLLEPGYMHSFAITSHYFVLIEQVCLIEHLTKNQQKITSLGIHQLRFFETKFLGLQCKPYLLFKVEFQT